jgi:hypothetical protein
MNQYDEMMMSSSDASMPLPEPSSIPWSAGPERLEWYLAAKLQRHGLTEEAAEAVMASVKQDKRVANMADRWCQPFGNLNRYAIDLLWRIVKRYARAWISENEPDVWCSPLFEDASSLQRIPTGVDMAKATSQAANLER